MLQCLEDRSRNQLSSLNSAIPCQIKRCLLFCVALSMTITILGATNSSCTPRVLITLGELGVDDYNLEPVDMAKKAHKSPEFLKLQPFGQVPVLRDNDLTLFGSRALTRYLAEKLEGQGTPLLGKTPKEKALVNQWLDVESQLYTPPVANINQEIIVSPTLGRPTEYKEVRDHVAKLERVLDVYEAHLASNRYLAGEFFSLADLHHLPHTHLLIHLAKHGGIAYRPHVLAWWNDIASRPAFLNLPALPAMPSPDLPSSPDSDDLPHTPASHSGLLASCMNWVTRRYTRPDVSRYAPL